MICIKPIAKSNGITLEYGKIYEVFNYYSIEDNSYYLKFDNNNAITHYYWETDLFISLAEWRENQINLILDGED